MKYVELQTRLLELKPELLIKRSVGRPRSNGTAQRDMLATQIVEGRLGYIQGRSTPAFLYKITGHALSRNHARACAFQWR